MFVVIGRDNASAEEVLPPPVQTSPPPRQIVTSGNYEYEIIDENNKAAWLTKVYNYTEKVKLPAVIDGYNIVGIGYYKIGWDDDSSRSLDFEKITLFSKENDTTVKKLIIPKGVAAIEPYAFNEMGGLEYLELPDSLRTIGSYNFGSAKNIKSLVISGGVLICDHCFDASIDRITVKKGVADSDYMIGMHFDNIDKMQGDGSYVSLGFDNAHIKELLVEPGVKTINLCGKYDNIILENSNTKVSYDQEYAEVGKISAGISKVKVKKKSGKYVYSWKPLNISVTRLEYDKGPEQHVKKYNPKSKIKYIIKTRNKRGKYKKVKTLQKTKIKLNKKEKVKVEAVCVLPKGRFWDLP